MEEMNIQIVFSKFSQLVDIASIYKASESGIQETSMQFFIESRRKKMCLRHAKTCY